jgi:hypothetical protein
VRSNEIWYGEVMLDQLSYAKHKGTLRRSYEHDFEFPVKILEKPSTAAHDLSGIFPRMAQAHPKPKHADREDFNETLQTMLCPAIMAMGHCGQLHLLRYCRNNLSKAALPTTCAVLHAGAQL